MALALVLFSAQAAWAADEEGWSYALAHEIMSPFCPGLSLSDCPSPRAAELREWIIAQEDAGATRQATLDRLMAEFGDQLLQAPRAEGIGLLAYGIPVGVLVVGGLLLAFMFSRRGSAEKAPASAVARVKVVSSGTSNEELEREIDRAIEAGQ